MGVARTVGIWIVAVALVALLAVDVEERSQRRQILDEQRYQSCMAQQIGIGVNLLALEGRQRVISGGDETSVLRPQGDRDVSMSLDEAIKRCSDAFPHSTTPTTARR